MLEAEVNKHFCAGMFVKYTNRNQLLVDPFFRRNYHEDKGVLMFRLEGGKHDEKRSQRDVADTTVR